MCTHAYEIVALNIEITARTSILSSATGRLEIGSAATRLRAWCFRQEIETLHQTIQFVSTHLPCSHRYYTHTNVLAEQQEHRGHTSSIAIASRSLERRVLETVQPQQPGLGANGLDDGHVVLPRYERICRDGKVPRHRGFLSAYVLGNPSFRGRGPILHAVQITTHAGRWRGP